MVSKPERPRAWFLQSKRLQQMQQAAAAGGSKQAAVAIKQGSVHGKVHEKVQKWRGMRDVCLSLLWYSVARGKQQENGHRQIGSARASPLAFCPVAGQPRRFSEFQKMARNAKCAFFVAMALSRARQAASSRRNTYCQVGSARASHSAFSLIASQPLRVSVRKDNPHFGDCELTVTFCH